MKKNMVVILLWALVIFAFIFSFRSNIVAGKLIDRFQESMPPEQVKERIIAEQFAKNYIKEWLTINKKEKDKERKERLQVFNKNIDNSGVVESSADNTPVNVAVIDCKSEKDGYLVDAIVNNDKNKPAAMQVIIGFNEEGKPFAKSHPLLIKNSGVEGNISINEYQHSVSDEVKTFIENFITAYHEGKDISQTSVYTIEKNIFPPGNSKFRDLIRVRGNKEHQPDKVEALYKISYNNSVIKQHMTISLQWQDEKPLVKSIMP